MKTRYSRALALKNGNSFAGDDRYWFERNDCSVIALANAFELTYVKAHSMCAEKGRKDCNGFNLRWVLKVSVHKKSRTMFGRRVGWHDRPHMTVGRFQKAHPKGTYIITVGDHVFTMIDSKLLNQSNLKDKISFYYYIGKQKATISQLAGGI